jgi:hypothetical protein
MEESARLLAWLHVRAVPPSVRLLLIRILLCVGGIHAALRRTRIDG